MDLGGRVSVLGVTDPLAAPEAPGSSHALDRDWLVPVATITFVELALWATAYRGGIAAKPMLATYGLLAIAFFVLVAGVKLLLAVFADRPASPLRYCAALATANRDRIIAALVGSQLLAIGSAAFGSLKAAIPVVNPFWLDPALVRIEGQAWSVLYSCLWWAVPFFDHLYGTFVLSHILAVLGVLALKPSFLKSRALISLALAWLVLGTLGAYLLSSGGPAFYDRVYGAHVFAGLDAMLAAHAPLTVMTVDALWSAHQSGIPMFGNGISAMPSLHVALTLWLALILTGTKAAPVAWAYYALIWTGSVLLGWHYASDGLIGSVGMLGCWYVAGRWMT